MTDEGGRVTAVRSFLLKYALRILAPDSELTIRTRFPSEWVVCSFCGESGWGIHPHYGSPCPIVVEMTGAAGMKMDAERIQAVRTGISFEEMVRMMRETLGDDSE